MVYNNATMAPISATTAGVTPQVIDDQDLCNLMVSLNGLTPVKDSAEASSADQSVPLEIQELCSTIEPFHKEWLFEEQVRFGRQFSPRVPFPCCVRFRAAY